jgi:APA family basic amino acid/polyamine antiporter
MQHLFKKRDIKELIEKSTEGDHTLKREISTFNLTMIGIGVIIGAGLFSITGIAAGRYAGPAVTISFIIAGLGCVFAALCYAEFSTMIPVAGSAYTYAYATLGEFIAWIIGWDLVLEYAVGAATVSISWSSYLIKLLQYYDIYLPVTVCLSPFSSITTGDGAVLHGMVNLPALFIVAAVSILLIRGVRESAWVNSLVVLLKVGVILIFVAIGWAYIHTANYTPYIPANTGTFGEFGWSGIIRAAGIIFFAFIGFDAISTAAQETENPQRSMPVAIFVSLGICTVLYILFAHVLTGMVNYKDFIKLDEMAPAVIAIQQTPHFWLQETVIFAILLGYTSVILVMLLGQSRVFYSMSRDGLLPKVFSDIHPKFKTPFKSNLLFMAFVGIFAGFVPAGVVAEMTSIGTLLAFVIVCVGVIVLRKTMPDMPRSFKTPWVPLVPLLGIFFCLGMMFFLHWQTWVRLIVWMLIGFVVYFGYSRKHSHHRQTFS